MQYNFSRLLLVFFFVTALNNLPLENEMQFVCRVGQCNIHTRRGYWGISRDLGTRWLLNLKVFQGAESKSKRVKEPTNERAILFDLQFVTKLQSG